MVQNCRFHWLLSGALAVGAFASRRTSLRANSETQLVSGTFGPGDDVRDEAPLDLDPLQASFVPKIIVVAGLPRTGSTSLGSIVQLWLVLADTNYHPSMVEPWMDSVNRKDYQAAKHENRSEWVKVHEMKGWVNELADVVVLSHRDPVEELVSTFLSWKNWGYDTAKTCDIIMDGQRHLYSAALDCCHGVSYDMQLEELISNPQKVLRAVAVAIGIPPSVLTSEVVEYATQVYMAHLPSSVEQGLPKADQVWHTDEQKASIRDEVHRRVVASPRCQSWWRARGAYSEASS